MVIRQDSSLVLALAVLLGLVAGGPARAVEPGLGAGDTVGMLGMSDAPDLGVAPGEVPDLDSEETEEGAPVVSGGPLLKAGRASWYGPGFHGRKTASGERYDQEALTCAMTGVPLGTTVRVERTDTGASVVLRVNDRGPYEKRGGRWVPHSTRVVDLSARAMRELGGMGLGIISVRVYRGG